MIVSCDEVIWDEPERRGGGMGHTFLGSPCGLNVRRRSVGEFKIHRNSGGSVRYLSGLLLDVEHYDSEGKGRVQVTCYGALLTHSLPPRVGNGSRRVEVAAGNEATFCLLQVFS